MWGVLAEVKPAWLSRSGRQCVKVMARLASALKSKVESDSVSTATED